MRRRIHIEYESGELTDLSDRDLLSPNHASCGVLDNDELWSAYQSVYEHYMAMRNKVCESLVDAELTDEEKIKLSAFKALLNRNDHE